MKVKVKIQTKKFIVILVGFKAILLLENKWYFKMFISWWFHLKDIKIQNLYWSNGVASKYIQQRLTKPKGEIN